jgi:hypothetical protein
MSTLLEKYGINPYEFLGIDSMADLETIKKAYRNKSKVYHPDRNGGSEVQFKILVLCYKHAKSQCIVSGKVNDFSNLKDQDRSEEIGHERTFHNTNFDDPETRKQIFADDFIDFETFKGEMKKMQGMSTSYVAENFYKKEIIEKFKKNGKFDRELFNAYFLKLKKDGKIQNNQLVKVEEVQAFNQDSNYMKVNIHDNMVINTDGGKKDGNYRDFKKSKEIHNRDIQEVLETDLKTISKLIKENKKDTGKISRKKLKELEMKAKAPVSVEHQLSFAEMKAKLEFEELERIRKEREEQKEVVERNKRIYDMRIQYR